MRRAAGRGRHLDPRRHRAGEGGDRHRDRRGRGQGAHRRHRPASKSRAALTPPRPAARSSASTAAASTSSTPIANIRTCGWSGCRRRRPPQFGGDPDNFNFPRYSLDASFLRAYEDGKPVATPQHLEWSARAPVDGEATFVVGNPGSTQRLFTSDQLAFQRELVLPITVTTYSELRGRLIAAMESDPAKMREGRRRGRDAGTRRPKRATRATARTTPARGCRWAGPFLISCR